MKKLLFLALSLLPISLFASGIEVNSSGGKVTVNVFTGSSPINAANQGAWINGIQVSTINCGANLTCSNAGNGILTIVGSAGGGGGGGGGSLAVGTGSFSASNIVSSPTSIINLSSGTFFIQNVAGATAYVTLNFSSITAQGFIDTVTAITAFYNFTSTSDARGNTFILFRSTTDNALSVIRSTFVFLTGYTSTADARGDTFVNFRSTTDAALSVIRTTFSFLATYTSTADARGDTFVNFRSTTDAGLTAVRSTFAFVTAYMSTSDAQQTTFVNFRSTTDSSMDAFKNFKSTTDARLVGDNFGAHLATQPANFQSITASSGVFNSSINVMDVIVSSRGVLTASVTSQYLRVSGSTIAVGGAQTTGAFAMVYASAGVAGQHLFIAQVNGTNLVIAGGGDNAGSGTSNTTISDSDWNIRGDTTGTTDVAQNSTMTAIIVSTTNIQSFVTAFMSTSDARGNTFVNFRSTTDARLIGDNFGSHLATQPANLQSLTASSGTFASSVTAYGGFTSTVGFLGASSTFNFVSAGTMTVTSSGTFQTLTASSFTITGGTICFNQTCMFFAGISSAPPVSTDLTFHLFNGKAYFGGDAVGAGGVGASGPTPYPFIYDGASSVFFSTINFPPNDFRVRSDGVGSSTITVKDSTGIWTASQAFSSFTFTIPVQTTGTWQGAQTFVASTTFLAPSSSQSIQGTLVVKSSGTFWDVITSSKGLIVPIATITVVNSGTIFTASETVTGNLIIIGSASVYGQLISTFGFITPSSTMTTLLISGSARISSDTVQGNEIIVGSETVWGVLTTTTGLISASSTMTFLYVDRFVSIGTNTPGEMLSITTMAYAGLPIISVTTGNPSSDGRIFELTPSSLTLPGGSTVYAGALVLSATGQSTLNQGILINTTNDAKITGNACILNGVAPGGGGAAQQYTFCANSASGTVSVGTNNPIATLAVYSPDAKQRYLFWAGTASAPTAPLSNPTSNYMVAVSTGGKFTVNSGSPTISSCGTVPNGAIIGGTDQAGVIQVGGGVTTACTMTFQFPYKGGPGNPSCTFTDSSLTLPAAITAQSNTAFTLGWSTTFNGTVNYVCMGVRE